MDLCGRKLGTLARRSFPDSWRHLSCSPDATLGGDEVHEERRVEEGRAGHGVHAFPGLRCVPGIVVKRVGQNRDAVRPESAENFENGEPKIEQESDLEVARSAVVVSGAGKCGVFVIHRCHLLVVCLAASLLVIVAVVRAVRTAVVGELWCVRHFVQDDS